LAAVRGDQTLAQLSERFDVHANQINQWKNQLLERAAAAFDGGSEKPGGSDAPHLKELHAKIGQQALEIDFLAGALGRHPGPSAKR